MMKKTSILIVLVAGLCIAEVRSQVYETSNLSVGFNIGMDYNNNAYRMTEDSHGFTYYGMNPNLSLGLNIGYCRDIMFLGNLYCLERGFDHSMVYKQNPALADQGVSNILGADRHHTRSAG